MSHNEKREKEKLIREEQKVLDSVIQKMDQQMLELDRRLTEAQLRVQKNRGWADAYGALIDAQRDIKDIKGDKKYLRLAQSDLYKYHMKLECQDLYGDQESKELDLKIGMHSYMKGEEIYVLRWNNASCRPFIIDNSLEETVIIVEDSKTHDEYKTHLKLVLKRDIDLDFDEVTDVLQLFPLIEGDEQVIYDSFLQELVKRRSEQEFKNIVFSIQKKQGEIVQVPYHQNLIIQGCAGSGKSMIMLHRLPILLEDNPGVLAKNSIYVVSPSTQYIQMMEGLREDLELDDLSMGTIDDYYRYSIERYGHSVSECGRINPLLPLSKKQLDYVYGSDGLSNLIRELVDEQIKTGEVDLSYGQQFFLIKARTGPEQTTKDLIQKKLLMVQDILNENEKILRAQSKDIQDLLSTYRKLEQTLRSRKTAEERAINREIQTAKDTIAKQEQEIEKLNPLLNFVAIRNRRTVIKDQKTIIENLEDERSELEKDTYYEGLLKVCAKIDEFIKTNSIGGDPDNHREQYKTKTQYRQAREDYIEKMYIFLQMRGEIEAHVQRITDLLQQLKKPSNMRAESFEPQLVCLQNAANRLINKPNECLPYDYYIQLQKSSSYYNELSKSLVTVTYMKVMDRLGYRLDQRGALSVPMAATYIYLKILSFYYGPVESRRESLIAIDEAQNYTLEEVKLFREINGNSVVLNLFGDIHQKVEDEKGLNNWDELRVLGYFQTHFLKENYRNALQITKECNRRFGLDMEGINVPGKGVTEYVSIAELDFALKELLAKKTHNGLGCILVKHREEAEHLRKNYEEYNSQIKDLTDRKSDLSRNSWNMLLISQAKGLEFETVIVLSGRMTRNEKYIAFTRALDELIIFDQQYGKIEQKSSEEPLKNEVRLTIDNRTERKEEIKERIVKPNRTDNPVNKSELAAFLESSGCEVVDVREKSGRLWVIDSGAQTKQIVMEAIRKYHVSFSRGKGQETRGRFGWYTKSNK